MKSLEDGMEQVRSSYKTTDLRSFEFEPRH
jgi:hypothetical protein